MSDALYSLPLSMIQLTREKKLINFHLFFQHHSSITTVRAKKNLNWNCWQINEKLSKYKVFDSSLSVTRHNKTIILND